MTSSRRKTGTPEQSTNKVLEMLTRTAQCNLTCEPVKLGFGMVLQEPDHEIEHVYFPEEGLVSVQSLSAEGAAMEIGVVGSEGMVGIPAVLGGAFPYRAVVEIQGEGWRIRRRSLAQEIQRNHALHQVLLQYTNNFLIQVAQSRFATLFTACRNVSAAGF